MSKFVAAERSGKAVSVNWATASEKNSQSFAVQRSANGKEFTTLGTVAATGTSAAPHAYAFTDAAPLSGVNYYRLLQLDADGTVSYSPTATVRLNLVAAPAEAYPNPVIDRVSITSTAVGSATQWSLTNSRGQVVHTEALSAAAEAGRVELDLQPYAAGYYIVSLLADGQVLSRTKVVKGQ